jgi:hypothetical protein
MTRYGFAMKEHSTTVRLKVTPRVASLIAPDVSADEQRQAIEGGLPLSDGEQLTAYFLLAHRGHESVRAGAVAGLRQMPAARLAPLLGEDQPSQLLHFLARYRLDDVDIMAPLLARSDLDLPLLVLVAGRACPEVLTLLADRMTPGPVAPELRRALEANPAVDVRLLSRFADSRASGRDVPPAEADEGEDEQDIVEEGADDGWEDPSDEESGLSKYQLTLQMGVPEKIKAALNGDKEWRKLLIQDSNRLVSAAVLKNPRITEGEVLAVANNRGANEELIRIITLNREWMKNYAIKQALVVHPRVPLAQALRYMSVLTDRDLKMLTKSRDVSQAIVNNARRMLNAKQQRR